MKLSKWIFIIVIKFTKPILLKQVSLNLFTFVQYLIKGKFLLSYRKLKSAINFFDKEDNWNNFDEIISAERSLKIKTLVNIYAGSNYKSPLSWLLDPSYKNNSIEIKNLIGRFKNEGWEIGLHPSFFSFDSKEQLFSEKKRLEKIVGKEIINVRQHWLRFSWEKTWKAQKKAGLKSDFTLMFNDRYGFRNSTALSFSSYYEAQTHKSSSSSFMDSLRNRDKAFDEIISELKSCYGETNILWHNHTLSSNYGWYDSWRRCLNILKR